MNEIVNNFLLVGEKFILEMHLIQFVFIYNACRPFIKAKDKNLKF